jgi:hypothetical protein
MATEFLQPRFVGARFDQHTLPVEVARDLAAYEELIIQLARVLYLREHPTRKRVPKGFADDFSLRLERVEDGSTKVVLVAATIAAVGLLPLHGSLDGQNYYIKARDAVSELVTTVAADQRLPPQIPRSLLEKFNTLGRSLRPGEAVDLAPEGKPAAMLTPEVRKKLVRVGGGKSYTAHVSVSGIIVEINWEKDQFQLRLADGQAVTIHLPSFYRDNVRAAGGKARTQVQVAGLGIFDMEDRLQKVTEIVQLETFPNQELVLGIENLSTLAAGWLGDGSKGLDKIALAWAKDQFAESFPDDLPFPQVAATPDGGLFLEWVQGAMRVSAEIMLPAHRVELLAVNTETGAADDTEMDLDGDLSWLALYAFVRQRL